MWLVQISGSGSEKSEPESPGKKIFHLDFKSKLVVMDLVKSDDLPLDLFDFQLFFTYFFQFYRF